MLYLAIKWMCDFPWQTVTNSQMVFHGKSQSEMDDDLGYPPFQETSIWIIHVEILPQTKYNDINNNTRMQNTRFKR